MSTPETTPEAPPTPELGWLTRPFRLLTIAADPDAAKLRTPSTGVPSQWLTEEQEACVAFAERLLQYTREHKGAGFAAPQLNIPLNVFVFTPGHGLACVVFNPRTLKRWPQTRDGVEQCFSAPGESRRVTRWEKIRVTADRVYTPATGRWEENVILTLREWDARVWQHEFDHLVGRLITDHGRPAQA